MAVEAEGGPELGTLALTNHKPPRASRLLPADFDGDGALDLAMFRHKGGAVTTWLIDASGNGFGTLDTRVEGWYADSDDQLVPANYSGDARADLAVYNSAGELSIDVADDGYGSYAYWIQTGAATVGDPIPADYNHDGKLDLAVVGDDGAWRIDFFEAADDNGQNLGFAGWDLELFAYGGRDAYPVVADFDGDTWNDIAVRKDDGTWRIDRANSAVPLSPFGGFDMELHDNGTTAPGEHAFAADFDGDLRADLALRSNGTWLFDLSRNNYGTFDAWSFGWGGVDTQPVPGDYNKDGLADLAVKDDCGGWRIDYTQLDAQNRPVWAGIDASASWASSSETVVVSTKTQLLNALARDFVGTIQLWGTAAIDLGSDRGLSIPPCARLTSTRNGVTPGGLISSNVWTGTPFFIVTGDHVRIDHLRLRGPGGFSLETGVKVVSARDFRIDHVEASLFSGAAISIDDPLGRITRTSAIAHVEDSYLHHNEMQDKGYGVAVGKGAWAYIERNTFDWNRHGITSDGEPETGYFAYRNLFLEGVTMFDKDALAHIDVHGTGGGSSGHGGTAGEYFDIGMNYVRGNQEIVNLPGDVAQRPAINLRGTPTDWLVAHNNVFEHGLLNSVLNCWYVGFEWDDWNPIECTSQWSRYSNRYDHDSTADLAVGDFDADGRADVFMGTGISWWYSSGGQTEWRFLRETVEVASELYFANVDGDPKTDVLYHKSDGVLVFSSGGTGPWTTLTTTPASPLPKLHFADFDGDNVTDIFRTTGTQWWIWHGNVKVWFPHVESAIAFTNLRFGQFDDAAGVDVLAVVGGQYKFNRSGSAGGWTTLNASQNSLSNVVVANLDGDTRSDLVKNGSGATWLWMPRGQGAWVQRRGTSWPYLDVRAFRFGNFDGGAQQHALKTQGGMPYRFMISRGAAEIPHELTSIGMR